MRALQLALISFVILFSVITAIGLLFPSTVRVSRAVNINASYDSVYQYLEDIKYWKVWMSSADTATIAFLSAKTKGTGTVATIGTGRVSMYKCTADSVLTEWKSAGGNVQHSAFVVLRDSADRVTTVQWYFEQQVGWLPWERFGSMANDKILGPVMEESLGKLKQVLEQP